MKPLLMVEGIDPDTDDEIYEGDGMFWNVAKAKRHCLEGKFGRPFVSDLASAIEANKNVEVDGPKVARFTRLPDVLTAPLIMIEREGKGWLIDGHHRLRALHAIGLREFLTYVIPADLEPDYRITFNGQRTLPT